MFGIAGNVWIAGQSFPIVEVKLELPETASEKAMACFMGA